MVLETLCGVVSTPGSHLPAPPLSGLLQNTSAWNCGRPQAVSSLRLGPGRLLADGEGEGEAPAQPLPSARASNQRYGGMEEEDDDFFTGGTVRLCLERDVQAAGGLAAGCMAGCRGCGRQRRETTISSLVTW